MTILESLNSEFNDRVSFREKRPGVVQVLAPLFHEDGDMVDIFLDFPKNTAEPIRISDHGMTLMRLSYSYDLDTPSKQKVLSRILAENGLSQRNGRLFADTTQEHLYPSLLQFAQTVAKVSNMQAFKREVTHSLFYESLDAFVADSLATYHPERGYIPMPDRRELEVDWRFAMPSRDIFLFGVKDGSKARLASISCLEYQKRDIPFRSVIVHDDFESGLFKKDQSIITNVADKQFTTLASFEEGAAKFFAREAQQVSIQ